MKASLSARYYVILSRMSLELEGESSLQNQSSCYTVLQFEFQLQNVPNPILMVAFTGIS